MEALSTIHINLTALDENLAAWRHALAKGAEICPVLKADAYGLGAGPVSRRLAAGGIKMVAVYNMQQAQDLVATGLGLAMLVLMPVEELNRSDPLYRAAVAGKLHLSVHSAEQLDKIEAIGTTFGIRIPVHVEVDTGLSRLGMSLEEADELIPRLQDRRYLRLAGLYSHAAAADSDSKYTAKQFERFEALLARHASRLQDVTVHFAGTHASLLDARYHRSMVRLGLGLFGYRDESEPDLPRIERVPGLRPVMRWTSRIVHTRLIPAKTSVGYERTFVTKRRTRLGMIPVGHADGYPVAMSNKAVMRVGGELHEAPVRGQVNMDQVSIDLTDVPEAMGVGTEVELVADASEAPNALPRLAELARTNMYELLCRLNPRIQRRYIIKHAVTGQVGHVATT